ncbi:MAG: sensor histidine kinase [Campylobacterota bacterium]|nr:sensor histidine kinase [Campylobacterota bacterium]
MKFLLFLLLSVTLYSHNIQYFEQKNETLQRAITQETFLDYDAKHSNFGFTQSTYWLKVELQNAGESELKQLLHLPYTLLDYIDIYELQGDKLILVREYGDLRVYQNDGYIPEPTFEVELKPLENKTYFYKIRTQGSMNIELIVRETDEFTLYSLEKLTVFSFYFGAVFIMLIYNLALYLFIKDRSYVFYLLFHMNYLLFALTLNGFSFAFIWPETPQINSYAVVFLMSVGSTLAVLFTMNFLDIKATSTKLYQVLRALFLLNLLLSILTLFISYYYASILTSLLSIISIVIIIGSSIYSYFALKNPNAKLFIFAWGALLTGIFIIHFRNMGLLSVNLFTSHSPLIGAFIELTLLSIALANRYNIQQEEIAAKDIILHKQSRLASMGEMIANIAHQWRQPLNRVNISLAVIKEISKKRDVDREMIAKKINYCEENISYMSETINDFSDFFKPDKTKEMFNVFTALQKAFNLLESRIQSIELELPQNRDIELFGFENEYVQVVLVIVENAIDNFISSGVKSPCIRLSLTQELGTTTLKIEDNGGGISEENIDCVFDPYFTTKFKDEGAGVGLYMAKMLVENSMNGELRVSSKNSTTLFEIKIKGDS